MAGAPALGRLGAPDDLAGVIAFLLGPDARWVTGTVVEVTGGLRRPRRGQPTRVSPSR
jgi:3-oxoacyl-[acyl-carrier protein] reductase